MARPGLSEKCTATGMGVTATANGRPSLPAHRQLSSPVDLDTLDEVLTERYRRDTEVRAKARDTLISRIRAGLPEATESTKY